MRAEFSLYAMSRMQSKRDVISVIEEELSPTTVRWLRIIPEHCRRTKLEHTSTHSVSHPREGESTRSFSFRSHP